MTALPDMRQFLEFCEAQPPEKTYEWHDARVCACAQFSHTLGMTGKEWSAHFRTGDYFWPLADLLASGCQPGTVPVREEWTFGRLTQRIRRVLK